MTAADPQPAAPAQAEGTARRPPVATARGVDTAMVLWMAGLSALWGFNAVTIKAVTSGMEPVLAAGMRGAVALVFLVPWGLWRGERLRVPRQEALHGVALGLIFAVEFWLFYTGARLTTGGHVAIYISTAPFFVAVGAHFLLVGDRLTALRVGGLLLAFAGVVLLFYDDSRTGQTGYWRGDLLVIAGAGMWGLSTLYVKRFMVASMSGFEMLYLQILVSTPLLVGLGLWGHPGALAAVPLYVWGLVLFQGAVIVFFSYLMWMVLLRIYPASAIQSFTFLTPIWGVTFGVLLLGERATVGTAVAIGLVGLGLYLINRPRSAH